MPGRVRSSFASLGDALPPLLRFIVILREPVSRAISSYWFKGGRSVANGTQLLEAQIADRQRMEKCMRDGRALASCGADGRGGAFGLTNHIDKGVYAPQLERWFRAFDRCHFYVTTLERTYMRGASAASAQLRGLLAWAGVGAKAQLSNAQLGVIIGERRLTGHNPHEAPFPDKFRARLGAFYTPYNQQLAKLIGSDVLNDWAAASTDASL